jgi:hypothetical protein
MPTDAERLACYDRLFGAPGPSAPLLSKNATTAALTST